MLIPLLLAAMLTLILIGIICTTFGMRGKRLNDHPICRACGFDLENIYPARSTCPECGKGLEHSNAVMIGQRRRRPAFVIAGTLLIVIPLAPIIGLTWAAASGKNLNNFKPLAVLLWEARHSNDKYTDAIGAELMDRMVAGTLGKSEEASVAQIALDRQENPNIQWNDLWGDLFEHARFNGNTTKEDQQRFLRNAAVPRIVARPRVATGANVPMAVEAELRLGSSTQAMIHIWLEKASIGGTAVSRVSGSGGSAFPVAMFAGDAGPLATIWALGPRGPMGSPIIGAMPSVCELSSADIPVDAREVEAQLLVSAARWDATGKAMMDAMTKPKATSPRVRAWTLKAPVEFVPPDQAAIARVAPTAALDANLARKLNPTYAMLMPSPLGGKPRLYLDFPVTDLPVPVAFEVFAKSGDKTVRIGEFTSGWAATAKDLYSIGEQPDSRQVRGPSMGSKVKAVDIILKPITELAARTTDVWQIYGGEIVFKDVAVNGDTAGQFNVSVNSRVDAQEEEEAAEATAKQDEKPKKKSVPWSLKGIIPW